MRDKYWHDRCERWGAARVGARGYTKSTLARLRDGTPRLADPDALPELHLEESETHELIRFLPPDVQAFLCAVYPWQRHAARRLGIGSSTLNERLNVAHRMLARVQAQRKRGEPVDPGARRGRYKVRQGSHAAVQVER